MASAFGVFQIVANDGRQDHMLMATELLNQRIQRIKDVRTQAGFIGDDIMPSILDIERTHIIFVTAHFKPFAAIAFEYHRVESSGAPGLDKNFQYSLPMYGDFFADIVHHVVFEQYLYSSTHPHPNRDSYRYADFVGERLHKEVKFTVNGNKLDDYTCDAYSMHRQFNVAPNKKAGWYRMVGQELPNEAFLAQETEVQPMSRVGMEVFDGFQTPKRVHPALEVTVPLLFWFCKDFRLAIPSVAIPYGQRWIQIQTAKATELVEIVSTAGTDTSDATAPASALNIASAALYVNNLFVNSDVHDIFIKRIGFTLIRVHLRNEVECAVKTQKVKLESLQWPIEAMYFGFKPKVNYDITTADSAGLNTHKMYSRLGGRGTLQNWHRFNHVDVTSDALPGVQTSKADVHAELDYKAIAEVAKSAVVGATPAAEIALVRAQFALVHAGSTFPKSEWGKYAMASIEASASYESSALGFPVTTAGAQVAVRNTIKRIANEYRESAAWVAVPSLLSATAASQLASYAALMTAATGTFAVNGITTTYVSDDLLAKATTAAAVYGADAQSVWDTVNLSGFLHRHVRMGNTARVEVRRGSPSVSKIGLSAHNVKLFDDQYASFFHSYLTHHYGGPNLNTPDDESLHLISFALYPGTYQPSGHLNISRAREFHLTYTATRTPSNTEPLQMLIYVKAINFLLIADGSASLRYTT